MEIFDFGQWMTAASALTAPVMVWCQWLKSFAWFRNSWTIVAAPFIGISLVVLGLVCLGQVYWDPVVGLVITSPIDFYRGVVQGFFGGAAAPIGYQLQAGLPEQVRPFKPGPDNYGKQESTNGAKISGV